MNKNIFEAEEKVIVQTIKTVVKSSVFTENLITARKDAGLTLVEVGKHFGSGHTRITNWESGTAMPKLKDLVKLCRVYQTTPNKLLGFE